MKRENIWLGISLIMLLVVMITFGFNKKYLSNQSAAVYTGSNGEIIHGPFPDMDLPDKAQGQGAINALGNKLAEVAAWYDKDEEEFKNLLKRDKDLWVDKKGRLLYHDSKILTPENLTFTLVPTSTPPLVPPYPIDQTFKLHSKPGSTKTIYLDFDGYSMSGTAWNQSFTNGQPLQLAPYDLDGDSTTFSSDEKSTIQMAWQRVAEDYAPFDIDVTTELTNESILTRSSTSDNQYGIRAAITLTPFTGGLPVWRMLAVLIR